MSEWLSYLWIDKLPTTRLGMSGYFCLANSTNLGNRLPVVKDEYVLSPAALTVWLGNQENP